MSTVFRCGAVIKDVGKNLKNTKMMAKWGMMINETRYVITVKHSLLSGKKVIWANDKIIKENKQLLGGDFDYTWSLEKHIFKIDIFKDKEGHKYQLSVDEVDFFDLPEYKKKDEIETNELVERLKSGPAISSEPVEEEEEEVEIEEYEDDNEDESEFFSNRGGDENWLDFSVEPVVMKGVSVENEEEMKAKEEAELKKKRVQEYTAGLVNLDFGL